MPQLLPPIKTRFVGSDNLPLVGGKVYAFTAGTTTPKATYTTYGMGAANAHPVVLDSDGQADIWLDGAYKIRVLNADDELQFEVDDVRDLTSSQSFASPTFTGAAVFTGTAVTWSGNPTHSGNHTFTGNVTVNGNTTLGNAASDTLTMSSDAVTWNGNPTHSGNHAFSGNVTVNGNTTLGNAGSDTVTVAAAMTLTGDVTVSTTGGELRHGPNYTPTLGTITANVASSSANPHRWFRVGDCVTVQGSISVTPTAAAATTTQLGISLPIATNFAALTDVQAPALSHGNLGNTTGFITASVASDIVFLTFFSGSTGADTWSYTFVYEVKA